ncbi:MAG: response regulator [Chloroflexi bacterium]|nr:response regulator [Chloroflexota bacterium]
MAATVRLEGKDDMSSTSATGDVNLAELRQRFGYRLAMVLTVSGLLATAYLFMRFDFISALPLGVLVAAGIGFLFWQSDRPGLARHALAWGPLGALAVAMLIFPSNWLPFLGAFLSFSSSVLVGSIGLLSPFGVIGMTALLSAGGLRDYPLPGVVLALFIGVVLTQLSLQTFYTALEWAWTMQGRADDLLEMARDQQGELRRALKSVDLTNGILMRMQRELIVARQQAERARLMKEQFAANISHEFRTPLNLILGFSEMIYLTPEVYGAVAWPAKLRRAVYQIYRSSQHLLGMVNDVLDLSRFEIVGFTLERESTDIGALLRETMGIARDLFRERKVSLRVDIPENLPTISVDRTRIRQVALNLLSNAARFTEVGEVCLSARCEDHQVVVSVRDTGIGISADVLPHVFEEFYQIDRSLHRQHGGAGLGLAICKRFVEAHGGRIEVESQEGIGSCFSFRLPLEPEPTVFARLEEGRPAERQPSDTHPSILIVDPDPAIVGLIGRYIEGYDAIQLESCDDLHAAVALYHPDAVIINAPDGANGDIVDLDAVPTIVCSLPSRTWLTDGLQVSAFLTKPITRSGLESKLAALDGVHDIMITDDDRGFCQLVEQMLETSGTRYNVRRAYSGSECLAAMRLQKPDLLLLDLAMPGMDGVEVLQEMRRDAALADVPVILISVGSYYDDAAPRRSSRIVVQRSDGLGQAEAMRCLAALVGVLEPRYDERALLPALQERRYRV